MNLSWLADQFADIEARNARVTKICLPALDASEWKPETDALQCQMGCLGWYKNKPVYVSRAIPTGYFYEGPRIPEIHSLPHADMLPQPDAEIPPEIEAKVGMALKPFMTSRT